MRRRAPLSRSVSSTGCCGSAERPGRSPRSIAQDAQPVVARALGPRLGELLEPLAQLDAARLLGPPAWHGREGVTRRQDGRRRLCSLAAEGGLECGGKAVGLGLHLGLVTLLEGREHLAPEQLEGLA